MLRQDIIDRICAETLSGRFGVQLVSPRKVTEVMCPSAEADVVTTIRNAAIWTNARGGIEQGNS